MSRFRDAVISIVLIVALVFTLCTARPAPVYANSDTTTILIVLGGVIGGLMLLAVIITLIVRNNPAWMPALPPADGAAKRDSWDRPNDRLRFAWQCDGHGGTVPLVCW
jgi:hypothetical protein